jgi:hypothetical protein
MSDFKCTAPSYYTWREKVGWRKRAMVKQTVTVASTKNPFKVEGVKVIFGNGIEIRGRKQLFLLYETFSC